MAGRGMKKRPQMNTDGHRVTRPVAAGGKLGAAVRRVVVMVVVAFAGFYVFFYFAQTSVVFHSERELRGDPGDKGWDFEEVRLDVGGETTHGWFVPLAGARGVVLFCHGNGGNISNRLGEVVFFRELGFSVMLYDYGGYGKSTGRPSEKRVYADGLAVWEYLVEERGLSPERIVIWGRSFGGGAACDLGARVAPGAVVLESTFLSKVEAGKDQAGWIPWGLLLRYRFSNASKVGRIGAPLLVIHSRDDTLFPLRHGRGLYRRAGEPKTFLEVRGDHHDVGRVSARMMLAGASEFFDGIRSFRREESGEGRDWREE